MQQYLDLLKNIKRHGVQKNNRTLTAAKSIFGVQLRHSLNTGFPLLTTKKLYFKAIANELIWFLNGGTNIKYLNDNNVNIWNQWATENGDLGPIYGKQWVSWELKDGSTFNQIDQVIHSLKNNHNSRRILFHSWNIQDLPDESISPQENVAKGKMSLAPCHLLYQFYVANNKLSSQVYIRSSDAFLGLPYNIASLALLTHILAAQCDLKVEDIVITLGDSHIYNNHYKQVATQLTRKPKTLPQLLITKKPKSIYDYKFEDFKIIDYNPYPNITGAIAI